MLYYRLHDTFRNTGTNSHHENVELACDGVIMDMDYNPIRYTLLYLCSLGNTLYLCYKNTRASGLKMSGI